MALQHIYKIGDLQNMDRPITMLLYQMKQLNELNEVRAPDRCEGLLNDTWQVFQHIGKTETEQDKITKFWKVHTEEDVKKYLMSLRVFPSTYSRKTSY